MPNKTIAKFLGWKPIAGDWKEPLYEDERGHVETLRHWDEDDTSVTMLLTELKDRGFIPFVGLDEETYLWRCKIKKGNYSVNGFGDKLSKAVVNAIVDYIKYFERIN